MTQRDAPNSPVVMVDLEEWREPWRERILKGFACIICGDEDGAMTPYGLGPEGQVFAHPNCGRTSA